MFEQFKKSGVIIPKGFHKPDNGWNSSQFNQWKHKCNMAMDNITYIRQTQGKVKYRLNDRQNKITYSCDINDNSHVLVDVALQQINKGFIRNRKTINQLKTISIDPNTYYIYMLISPIGKIYVGQTFNPYNRMNTYRKLGGSTKSQRHLYQAIQKYGFEQFQIYIIKSQISSSQANTFEQAFIRFFDSANRQKGYNLMLGGRNRKRHLQPKKYIKMSPQDKIKSREHARIKNCKEYLFVKNDQVFCVNDLRVFCDNNSLSYFSMSKVHRGVTKSHKGFTKLKIAH